MKLIIIIICFFIILPSHATEASKYITDLCRESNGNKKTHIIVKREYSQELFQRIGQDYVNSITYGYGDLKVKGLKKCRIVYICIFNRKNKPIWGCVNQSY